MRQFSKNGLDLTKRFEGLELTAYMDQGGVWTIGYGHTGPEVQRGMKITQAEADAYLEKDVQHAVNCVNRVVTAEVNQNQFDALVDFTFNFGCGALTSSTLLREVNAGNFENAAAEFARWRFVKKVESKGLIRRRTANAALFSKQEEA